MSVSVVKQEEVKHRPIQEIHQEYTNLCTRAGHLQYQLFTLDRDLEAVNEILRNLNFEAAAANEAAANAAKEEADKKSAESPAEESKEKQS